MSENSLSTTKSWIVTKAYKELNIKEEIVVFMLNYFKNFIVTTSTPSNLSFQDTIDAVNRMLLEPTKDIVAQKEISKEDFNRVNLWQSAHSEFEVRVVKEVKRWV